MNAWDALLKVIEFTDKADRLTALEEWRKTWVLSAEMTNRVKKTDLEKGGAPMMQAISASMKDSVFTAIGRDRGLMFHIVRPVGDLYEFRLALAVLRPVPAPDYPAGHARGCPGLGGGACDCGGPTNLVTPT